MKSVRWLAIFAALALLVGACGGGEDVDEGEGGNGSSTTAASNVDCEKEAPEAVEKGVTADTITVTVTADVDNAARPGLFRGAWEGAEAWAKWRNETQGGLACRQIKVIKEDSHLSADEAKNALIKACKNSLATVGTAALFLNDMSASENCKDKAGQASGMTDFAVVQTEPSQQCSEVSFPALPGVGSCPYSGTGERTTPYATTAYDFLKKEFGDDALHGTYVVAADLPSTITASVTQFTAAQQEGIKADSIVGQSGLADQSKYTPIARQLKQDESTYAQVGLDYKGTVYLRKEAQVQGVDTVKAWACTIQCYDPKFLTEGGAAAEGQYVWINQLPFEDKGSNDMLDALLEYNPKSDGFGAHAWIAAEAFATVVNKIVESDGVNGITRAAVLEGTKNLHDYNAGGLLPDGIDFGARKGSSCIVMMHVEDGKFVRVSPTEPGEFDCSGEIKEVTLDPNKPYEK